MRKWILGWLVALLCFVPVVSLADAALPPRPQHNYYDELNMLSAQSREQIDRNDKQIVVATIADLQGEDAHSYGVRLFEAWGIGRKGADDGVLLMIAFDSVSNRRYVEIIPGAGREGVLTDAACGRIIDREMMSDLKQKKYDEAIMKGVAALERAYEDPEYAESLNPSRLTSPRFVFPTTLVVLLILGTILRFPYAMRYHRSRIRGVPRTNLRGSFVYRIGTLMVLACLFLSSSLGITVLIILSLLALTLTAARVPGGGGFWSSGGFGGFRGGSGSSFGSSFGGGSTSGGGAGRSF